MARELLPAFASGAVYFRKSNPPREDWERDYRTAAEDGLNLFRHWFLWPAIEVAPGVYDWEEYDRQLDLAAEHGLKTIIAEMITAAPEWAFRAFAHARFGTRDGPAGPQPVGRQQRHWRLPRSLPGQGRLARRRGTLPHRSLAHLSAPAAAPFEVEGQDAVAARLWQ
jgi:hypothetical protein